MHTKFIIIHNQSKHIVTTITPTTKLSIAHIKKNLINTTIFFISNIINNKININMIMEYKQHTQNHLLLIIFSKLKYYFPTIL